MREKEIFPMKNRKTLNRPLCAISRPCAPSLNPGSGHDAIHAARDVFADTFSGALRPKINGEFL